MHPNPPLVRRDWESQPIRGGTVSNTVAELSPVSDKVVSAHAHYAEGIIAEMQRNTTNADENFAQAVADDPADEQLVMELTRRYLLEKKPEQAQQVLEKATALPGASGALFARLGFVYAQLGKEDQARMAGQMAVKRSLTLMDGYRTLFFLDLQNGRAQAATETLNQAFAVKQPPPEFNVELANLYAALAKQAPSEKKGLMTNVLAVLHRADQQQLTKPELRLQIANDYNLLGLTKEAAQGYQDLLDYYTQPPQVELDVRDKLVDIDIREHNYKGAMTQLQAIVELDPANGKAYFLLASLAEEQQKLPEAIQFYQRTLLLNDNFEQAYYDLARVQIDANKTSDALETLGAARKKFANNFSAEVLTAVACEREKDYSNAIVHFTTAEVLAKASEPNRLTSGFYFDEGAAYERGGNIGQAEACFKKSLELNPNAPEVLNYLGYMWAEKGVKLNEAHELIAKALAIEPNSAAYLDSLGWVLYKLNQPQEALPNLERAIKLSESPDPTLYDHLGDIFAALKQTEKARAAWSKSVSLEKNAEVQKKLDGGKSQ